MTLDQLIDRLIELNEAGYGDEPIVLTTRSGAVVDPFQLALIVDGALTTIPTVQLERAEIRP